MSAAQLAVLDTNKDGKLIGAELNGLNAWTDSNEDGIGQTTELTTLATALANAGLSSVRSTDYAFYASGNAGFKTMAQGSALAPAAMPVAPASNYRTLRDTDNQYLWAYGGSYGSFTWASNQVKINYNNKTYLIGTDGNDNFDANYYAQYNGTYFNINLLVNFLAGAGADVMGGSVRNDNLWGGTGNDTLFGYDGDDKLYGEEGSDELQGGNGNDQLDGGTGDDRLFGQVGNDVMNGGDGNDIMMGFTASNETKQTLAAGETDDDVMYGGAGDDWLLGSLGSDQLWGGVGADELQGGDGNDQLYGEDGNDRLFGGGGDETIYGGNGDDLIVGGVATNEPALAADVTDNNFLYGSAGNDTIIGGIGNDYIDYKGIPAKSTKPFWPDLFEIQQQLASNHQTNREMDRTRQGGQGAD